MGSEGGEKRNADVLKFGVVGRLGRGQEREVPREEREGLGRRRLSREVMPHLQQEGLNKNTARSERSKVRKGPVGKKMN